MNLTGRILAAATAPPDPLALDVMRLSVVDWMAVGIAGSDEPAARAVRDMIEEEGGTPVATLFGGGKAPARAAALLNGTTSHALDYDDTHFAHIGHLSVGILPAVAAMGERNNATVGQVIRAALAGCEAAIRMGQALGRDHYQSGFHQTATAGAFGATLGACLVQSVDPMVQEHALGLASTRASGLKSQFGTDGKPFNAGLCAANGVEASLLAGRGMVSNPAGWDGPGGFLETHNGRSDAEVVTGFLMPDIQHKFHACCHGLHAALEALETLKPVAPDSISEILVTVHPRWLTVCDKPAPRTGLEAKFSYRATMALSLLGYDTASLGTYRDALVTQPDVAALRDRVRVTSDDALAETEAVVRIGTQIAHHDLAESLPLDLRRARIKAKAATLVGTPHAEAIWAAVHENDNQPLRVLTDLMTKKSAPQGAPVAG